MSEYTGPIIRSAQVVCPLYITDDLRAQSLTCEGYDDSNVLLTRFRNASRKYKHMSRRCAKNYRECPIYKLIVNERYGGED